MNESRKRLFLWGMKLNGGRLEFIKPLNATIIQLLREMVLIIIILIRTVK